jgi:hypothetical protein
LLASHVRLKVRVGMASPNRGKGGDHRSRPAAAVTSPPRPRNRPSHLTRSQSWMGGTTITTTASTKPTSAPITSPIRPATVLQLLPHRDCPENLRASPTHRRVRCSLGAETSARERLFCH